jgi:hypothetical protein
MKSTLFSLITGTCLLAATACSSSHEHDHDNHRGISPQRRARHEAPHRDNRLGYDKRDGRHD